MHGTRDGTVPLESSVTLSTYIHKLSTHTHVLCHCPEVCVCVYLQMCTCTGMYSIRMCMCMRMCICDLCSYKISFSLFQGDHLSPLLDLVSYDGGEMEGSDEGDHSTLHVLKSVYEKCILEVTRG